tara:strand:- start:21 stop:530 length:510 start_codon:yes stop_codon:yes gene_type:complete
MDRGEYHLNKEEERLLHFKMNFHNETVILLKGKEKGGIHILNAENSSFQKGNKILETKNDILKFIHHTIEQLGKEEQVDIVLLSEKVYKSTIDFLQENLNYSKIYLFEYGDIFYPKQNIQHMKEPIDIFYQIKTGLLQVSGFPSGTSTKREYHILYDGLWSGIPESLFK